MYYIKTISITLNIDVFLVFIVIIMIIVIAFSFFYINMKKTESFSQCASFDTTELSGYCKPFYGIPPSVAISPGEDIISLAERKAHNREAARIKCNNTPGCSGIFQNQSTDGNNNKHEAYLCKNEWDGSTIAANPPGFDFKVHKCSFPSSKAGTDTANNRAGDEIMLLYNLNGTHKNYTRHFDIYNHQTYDNMIIKDPADYILDSSGSPIEEILTVTVGDFEKNHLNRLFEFVRSYPDGIGFEVIDETASTKIIKFFKKRHSYSLSIKDSRSTSKIYTSIISDVIESPYVGYIGYQANRGSHFRQRISGNDKSNWPYVHNLWRMIRGQKGMLLFFATPHGSVHDGNNFSLHLGYYDGSGYTANHFGHFQDGYKIDHHQDGLNIMFHYIHQTGYMWIPTGPVNLDRANNRGLSGIQR